MYNNAIKVSEGEMSLLSPGLVVFQDNKETLVVNFSYYQLHTLIKTELL